MVSDEPKVRIDFDRIEAAGRAAIMRVLERYLPGGKMSGPRYEVRNPRRDDSHVGNFDYHTVKHVWGDFAASEHKGKGAISILAFVLGVDRPTAARELARFLGLPAELAPRPGRRGKGQNVEPAAHDGQLSTSGQLTDAPTETWVSPIPDDAPRAPRGHPKYGRATGAWVFKDAEGRQSFVTERYDPPEGRKQFSWLTLWRQPDGSLKWGRKGPPAPRSLYLLPEIKERAGAPVLILEGEKKADAATRLLTSWVSTSAAGGAASAGQSDWSPLRGRDAAVWPDADEPGATFAQTVAKLAIEAGASRVRILKVQALEALRGSPLPKGWDIADASEEGIAADAIAAMLDRGESWEQVHPKAKGRGRGQGRAQGRGARFELIEHGDKPGVYRIPAVVDRHTGVESEGAPEFIASPIRVLARTRDLSASEWGLLLELRNPEGQWRELTIPARLFGRDGADLRELLLDAGVELSTDRNRRAALLDYLAETTPDEFARSVARTGWFGSVFVLPDRVIGQAPERVVLTGSASNGARLGQLGTLADWRERIAMPAIGNSRLVFGLSAGFAAPVLGLVGAEGGGVGFVGTSTAGKTTVLNCIGSLYGPPSAYVRQARSTANALEGLAAAHSDMALLLDELGALDPKEAGVMAYVLANGQPKSRQRADGLLREATTWRTIFVVTGEKTLADIVAESGQTLAPGQGVRLVDVPADTGSGHQMFERLPAGMSAEQFANALRTASEACYGTALPAYLEFLTGHMDKARRLVAEVQRAFVERMAADAAGQVKRVAGRFALIGAGGELGTLAGVTGWPQGEAIEAAERCFAAWLERRGHRGAAEPVAMVEQVRHFLAAHGDGRFSDWDRNAMTDDRAPKTLLRAGFRKHVPAEGSSYFVFGEVFQREICKGLDHRAVAKELARIGALLPESANCLSRRERLPDGTHARVYRITPKIFDAAT